MQKAVEIIESEVQCRPTPFEFELAYQARIAMDCIRFAIKQIEHASARAEQVSEGAMQLLDALQRLESVERRFQQRSGRIPLSGERHRTESSNGSDARR